MNFNLKEITWATAERVEPGSKLFVGQTREKAVEERLRQLAGRAESFWAFLQGEYGVKLSSEDQENHNVSEFFFEIDRAHALLEKKS